MTPVSTFMTDDLNVVTHRTVAAHWCADCWLWVLDCIHLVPPLRNRLTPRDSFIRSFAYDRIGRRLEIRYRWKSAAQFSPISLGMFQELSSGADVFGRLQHWIREKRVSWKEVRTERKIVVSPLYGLRLVVERLHSCRNAD